MVYQILCWLTSKDVIETVLQIALLVATVALVLVGWRQAVAAGKQAVAAGKQAVAAGLQVDAANLQVEAAQRQIEASERQLQEVSFQGRASRRPFIIIEIEKTQQGNQTAVCNKGPGIAYDVKWRFLSGIQHLEYEQPGSLGVNIPVPVYYRVDQRIAPVRSTLSLEQITNQKGVRFDYKDSAGTLYWTKITRSPEGYLYTETGEVEGSA